MKRSLPFLLLFVLTACGRDAPPEPERSKQTTATAASDIVPLRFLERVTGGAEASERLPLIVAIHGLGDRPESFSGLFEKFDQRARFVFPYGMTPYSDGFSWFPISKLEPNALAQGTSKAARSLAALIEELERTRPTIGRPIVTGFSQGGMLSFTLAVLHPERVGEALPLAGMLAPPLYPSSWPMGKLAPPVHAFHGDADQVVPIDSDRASIEALTKVGFSADLKEYPGVRHTVSAEMRRDVFVALEAAIKRAAGTP